MTILDDRLVPAVDRMLTRLGIAAILEWPRVDSDYDVVLGVHNRPGATTSVALLVSPPVPVDNKLLETLSGSDAGIMVIQMTDSQVFIAGSAVEVQGEPKVGSTLTVKGDVWHVIAVVTYTSGTKDAAHQLFIRK